MTDDQKSKTQKKPKVKLIMTHVYIILSPKRTLLLAHTYSYVQLFKLMYSDVVCL